MKFFTLIHLLVISLSISILTVSAESSETTKELFSKAMEQIDEGRFDDALIYLDSILELDPNQLAALSNKGGVLIELEKYEEAIEYLDRALEINPNHVQTLNNKGIALFRLGSYEDSLSIYYEVFKLDPYNEISVNNTSFLIENFPFFRENGYVNIKVRNSQGQLVGSTQTDKLNFQIPFGIKLLEDHSEWEIVKTGGQDYKILRFSETSPVVRSQLFPLTTLSLTFGNSTFTVIEIVHDGFLIKNGDTITYELLVVRPII